MSKTTVGVLVFSLLTVIGWIGFEIYHAQTVIDYPPEYKNIKEMDDYFNEEILNSIDDRKENDLYNPFQLEEDNE